MGDTGAVLPLVVLGDRAVLGTGRDALVGSISEVRAALVAQEADRHPRWLAVDAYSVRALVAAPGVRVDRFWDVSEVHRLLHGGWAASPGLAWATLSALDSEAMPTAVRGDLFEFASPVDPREDLDSPVLPTGHLRPDAFEGWATSDLRLRRLAEVLLDLGTRQENAAEATGPRLVRTAHSESAAALLCVELERDGLPLDRATAEELIAVSAGPRPRDESHASQIRRERDLEVLSFARGRESTDLRNPQQVRELLEAVGVRVPNTRAHVLEPFRATHPVVEALLQWRKDERIATTYGYRWLDDHVGADDRLRGGWHACDGAAGRMTAQNGLHNLPMPLRPAVAAAPGHVFVRADLGQIEPRVLAVVSGDRALAQATLADDLYAPVAAKLRVQRPVAKVAVLAAMYGQRSGPAGEALHDLERAYPVAMRLLDDAYDAGVARRPLRTFGGRLIPLDQVLRGTQPSNDLDAARGRFARNAIIQGAAAELFKAWAATVRHGIAPLDAAVVLCLHDELLVHTSADRADEVVARVERDLTDSARRWAGSDEVRFVAETSVVSRWSEAKG